MARGTDRTVAVCSCCRSIFVAHLIDDDDYHIIGVGEACPSCNNEEFDIVDVEDTLDGNQFVEDEE